MVDLRRANTHSIHFVGGSRTTVNHQSFITNFQQETGPPTGRRARRRTRAHDFDSWHATLPSARLAHTPYSNPPPPALYVPRCDAKVQKEHFLVQKVQKSPSSEGKFRQNAVRFLKFSSYRTFGRSDARKASPGRPIGLEFHKPPAWHLQGESKRGCSAKTSPGCRPFEIQSYGGSQWF